MLLTIKHNALKSILENLLEIIYYLKINNFPKIMKYRQFLKSGFEVHGPRSQLLLGLEDLLGINLEGILVCFDLSG